MALIVANTRAQKLVDVLLAHLSGMQMGLFLSPHVPHRADTIADYLPIEASFPGYLRQNVIGWIPSVLVAGVAIASADLMTWTRTVTGPAQLVAGYFLVDSFGDLLWAELSTLGPFTMVTVGDRASIQPSFSLHSEFEGS